MNRQTLMNDVEIAQRLLSEASARMPVPMRWMWGQALLGWALFEMDRLRGTEEFTPMLRAFCDHYAQHPPDIDYADRAAPALITYAMQKKTGNPAYAALTRGVLDYIRHAPRVLNDAVNHLGRSLEGRFYPRSIWVDSLMMFGVFPAIYARETGDAALLDFAARQPRLYSDYMQDPEDKLWYHSYWVKAGRHHPRGRIYWGRGNGWVLAALPMIMEQIGPDHPEYEGILRVWRDTVDAVLRLENPDHTLNTVLNQKSYRELSATALAAAGILHGRRLGLLPEAYWERGEAMFHAVASAIGEDQSGLYLPEISAPTIPLHILPGLCYRLTPRGRNLSYGLAALAFAAMEIIKLDKEKAADSRP